jgi:hypothetical protein
MYINPNFSDNENECPPPADEVMTNGMDFIFEKCIEPMHEKLSVEDISLIGLIGFSFKIIAEQATMYEQIEKKNQLSDEENSFERN